MKQYFEIFRDLLLVWIAYACICVLAAMILAAMLAIFPIAPLVGLYFKERNKRPLETVDECIKGL